MQVTTRTYFNTTEVLCYAARQWSLEKRKNRRAICFLLVKVQMKKRELIAIFLESMRKKKIFIKLQRVLDRFEIRYEVGVPRYNSSPLQARMFLVKKMQCLNPRETF